MNYQLAMTLPIQPLCPENNTLPLRPAAGRRRPCLSAAWPDPPSRRERRRAVYSWSSGYGTLSECDKSPKKVAECSPPSPRRPAPALPPIHAPTSVRRTRNRLDLFAMPGIKSLVSRRRNSGENVDTSAPLVRRDAPPTLIRPTVSLASLRKCETVLALTNVLRSSSSSSSMEPINPVNRLRVSPSPHGSTARMCSRCSSLLTLASSSRYSLNTSTGGFVPVPESPPILCKLCLVEVTVKESCTIEECSCSFCSEVSFFM